VVGFVNSCYWNKIICRDFGIEVNLFYHLEIGAFLYATMECLLGIAFRDFVLIASDMTNAHSIMVMKDGKFDSFL
jgi:hypothetical protein